jgi:hypothetical protein
MSKSYVRSKTQRYKKVEREAQKMRTHANTNQKKASGTMLINIRHSGP